MKSPFLTKIGGAETVVGVKTFSNSPIVPTPTTAYQVATKDYVDNNAGSDPIWGAITGTLANQLDLQAALDLKFNKIGETSLSIGTSGGSYPMLLSADGSGGGSIFLAAGALSVSASDLTLNGASIYTTDNPPTYTEVGALGATQQATDSALLGGNAASTGTTGYSIAQRNASGYISATYFNHSNNATTSAATNYIMGTGDGYMRKKSLANVKTEIAGDRLALSGGTMTGKIKDSNSVYFSRCKYGSAISDPVAGDMYFT